MNTSQQQKFDLVVIGGGSGGYAAARTAADLGKKVAICDGAEHLGGLCILRGCMPSKTLIYSAEVLHLAQHGANFGLDIPKAAANYRTLFQRKDKMVREFADYRLQQLESERFQLFRSQATFSGADSVVLDDSTALRADRFLIATGSEVQCPAIDGLDAPHVLTSDDILSLGADVPESITVLGGGVIACELAQFLARIGCKVTVVQRSPRLLKDQSPEVSETIAKVFADEGITLYLGTELQRIEADGSVHFKYQGRDVCCRSSRVLNALGRVPATGSLNLDVAGVETASNGRIITNRWQQTSNPAIYAAGDCTGPHEIVHVAILQGECAAKHAFSGKAEPVSYRDLTLITFTDPQVARAGLSYAECSENAADYVTASFPFDDHGKSIVMSATKGYVAITASRQTGHIVAAESVGKDASELIHSMAVAITLKATVTDLLKVHWYHPTLSEIWTYPLEDIQDQLSAL